MKQYTTEWAKEWLKDNIQDADYLDYKYMAQDENGGVYAYLYKPKCQERMWTQKRYDASIFVDDMLEHPDGWEKSLVIREK